MLFSSSWWFGFGLGGVLDIDPANGVAVNVVVCTLDESVVCGIGNLGQDAPDLGHGIRLEGVVAGGNSDGDGLVFHVRSG